MLFESENMTKSEIMQKMVDVFDREGYLTDKELFYHDVAMREELFSTCIGFGIGIPHGKSDAVKEAGICTAKLEQEVVWNEETGDKVDMILMIAVRNKNDSNLHLQILSKLSRLLMHEDFREKLKNCNHEELYHTLIENLEV